MLLTPAIGLALHGGIAAATVTVVVDDDDGAIDLLVVEVVIVAVAVVVVVAVALIVGVFTHVPSSELSPVSAPPGPALTQLVPARQPGHFTSVSSLFSRHEKVSPPTSPLLPAGNVCRSATQLLYFAESLSVSQRDR